MIFEPIRINYSDYIPEILGQNIDGLVQNLLDGLYNIEKVNFIIRFIVESGYHFSPNALPKLAKAVPHYNDDNGFDARWGKWFSKEIEEGFTYAHAFARCGYVFDEAEIALMGDPKTSWNSSISSEILFYAKLYQRLFVEGKVSPWHDSVLSTRMTIQEGELLFTSEAALKTGELRKQWRILWRFGMNSRDLGFPFSNEYNLFLSRDATGWSARLEEYHVPYDKYHHLLQMVLLSRLTDEINQAIKCGRSFDWGNYERTLALGLAHLGLTWIALEK